jgi:protein ImuB
VFAAVYGAEGSSFETLLGVARDFSPRVETCGPREVTLDLGGLTRLFGDAKTIASELRRTAADRGLRVRIAVAGTRTAARLLVHHRAGITIVEPGHESAALDELRIELLEIFDPDEPRTTEPRTTTPRTIELRTIELRTTAPRTPEPANPRTTTLRRWGLRTLGDLARLPADDIAARLGQDGVAWQRRARGEDPAPLVPSVPEERFEQALDLEWPIDGLEPLSFVLARLMEPLSAHLERRDRGAAVLHVRLHMVKRDGVTREVHERSLQLPAPMRDARTLRTLALLDLESHPPAAAIDRVVVAVDPTPGRVIQFSLLSRPLPSSEQLSTLMARLTALMGEDRCGSAVTIDSWQPGAFEMKPFAPRDSNDIHPPEPRSHGGMKFLKERLRVSVSPWPVGVKDAARPHVAVRRFRFPVAARVRVECGVPVRVTTERRGLNGGKVEAYAGPWRASGGWWIGEAGRTGEAGRAGRVSWERDEWDVTLSDGATYRVFRERDTDAWFVEGIVD